MRQDDGSVNVFVGSGQALVLGSNATTLVTQRDPYAGERLTIASRSGNSTVDLSTTLGGGSLGGILDFRREMLDPTRNQLGQIAAGLVSVVNAQHRDGVDLAGNMGTDLFALGAVAVVPQHQQQRQWRGQCHPRGFRRAHCAGL